MDRRQFLRDSTCAALGLGCALGPASPLHSQGAINHPGRIDVHHHYLPPFRDGPSWGWSPASALADMDRHNVATAILSGVTFPEPLNDGTQAALDLARRANEYVATLAAQHPGRFGLFAGRDEGRPRVAVRPEPVPP